jgi:hypothetical protein
MSFIRKVIDKLFGRARRARKKDASIYPMF